MRILASLALFSLLAAAPAVAAPPPEHPSVDQANRILGIAAASTLPNSGKVIQAIDSSSYTYVQLQSCNGEVWLAAPRAKFTVGTTIAYGDGAVMKNFFSKSLRREFTVIIFVGGTEPAADQVCAK